MQVAIVTHVWGSFYSRLIEQQIKSLESTTARVTLHIVHHAEKPLDRWSYLTPNVLIHEHAFDKPLLLNRNIGRDLVAKSSTAAFCWFCDADYLFGPGSLEAVATLDPHAACMYWPRIVLRPEPGDWFDDWPEGVDPVERCKRPEKQRKAIGGCQIVPGHIARQWGYLDGEARHQQPATGDVFLNTKGDQAYRGWLQSKTGLPILPADIPNVMRLRHRIPETSQRHEMTLPEFRLHGTDATIAADEALSRD